MLENIILGVTFVGCMYYFYRLIFKKSGCSCSDEKKCKKIKKVNF